MLGLYFQIQSHFEVLTQFFHFSYILTVPTAAIRPSLWTNKGAHKSGTLLFHFTSNKIRVKLVPECSQRLYAINTRCKVHTGSLTCGVVVRTVAVVVAIVVVSSDASPDQIHRDVEYGVRVVRTGHSAA